MSIDNPILMTARAWAALPNYSCTLPTGTTPGKRWRRAADYRYQDVNDEWWQGRYGKPYPPGHELEGKIPIFWRPIIVRHAARRWPRHVVVETPRRPSR